MEHYMADKTLKNRCILRCDQLIRFAHNMRENNLDDIPQWDHEEEKSVLNIYHQMANQPYADDESSAIYVNMLHRLYYSIRQLLAVGYLLPHKHGNKLDIEAQRACVALKISKKDLTVYDEP